LGGRSVAILPVDRDGLDDVRQLGVEPVVRLCRLHPQGDGSSDLTRHFALRAPERHLRQARHREVEGHERHDEQQRERDDDLDADTDLQSPAA
jgi:hypothetical protein